LEKISIFTEGEKKIKKKKIVFFKADERRAQGDVHLTLKHAPSSLPQQYLKAFPKQDFMNAK